MPAHFDLIPHKEGFESLLVIHFCVFSHPISGMIHLRLGPWRDPRHAAGWLFQEASSGSAWIRCSAPTWQLLWLPRLILNPQNICWMSKWIGHHILSASSFYQCRWEEKGVKILTGLTEPLLNALLNPCPLFADDGAPMFLLEFLFKRVSRDQKSGLYWKK